MLAGLNPVKTLCMYVAKHTALVGMCCVCYMPCARGACAAGQRISTDLRWPAQAHAADLPKGAARCCALRPYHWYPPFVGNSGPVR